MLDDNSSDLLYKWILKRFNRNPLASGSTYSLSLFHFFLLVAVMEMIVKAQSTPDESWTGVTEVCGWLTRLGESSPPDYTLQIFYMLTVGFESLILTTQTDLQQRFPMSQGRCWPVLGMSSADPWMAVLGLRVCSCRWRVLQTRWYLVVLWNAFFLLPFSWYVVC